MIKLTKKRKGYHMRNKSVFMIAAGLMLATCAHALPRDGK